jgi:hypothetical protein
MSLLGSPPFLQASSGDVASRLGELLLIDALQRVVDAAEIIGCLGVIVDAKDEAAEAFYEKYDFVTVDAASWPRRTSRLTRRALRGATTSSRRNEVRTPS